MDEVKEMGDLSLSLKRKKSVSEFNYVENEFGINIPLGIFGKASIPLQISELLDQMGGETTKELPEKDKKKKKTSKKENNDVKLDPMAFVGILATIGIAALTTTGSRDGK